MLAHQLPSSFVQPRSLPSTPMDCIHLACIYTVRVSSRSQLCLYFVFWILSNTMGQPCALFHVIISQCDLIYSFTFDGHHFSSPNQSSPPPGLMAPTSLPANPSPSELKNRLWSVPHRPYLGYILRTPFHGALLAPFSTRSENVPLENDHDCWHPLANQTLNHGE